MSPDEQNDLDAVKQQLRQTEKLLAEANSRLKALELDNYEVKRNAKILTEKAEALKNETMDSLSTASDQMKQAHAVACGIFGMARLSWAFLERKTSASRVVYREMKELSIMESLLDALKRSDAIAIKTISEQVQNRVDARKKDNENTKNQAIEHLLALGFQNVQDLYKQLQTVGQV